MRIKLVIFDCDGVIADSEVLSARVLIDQLAEIGIPISMEDFRRDFLGRSFPTVAATIRQRFDRALPDDFEAGYRRCLLRCFETDLVATPGFSQMIDGLDRACCVATSSSPPRVRKTLEVLGLKAKFGPHVFTASQVEHGKPAPDLFLFAARRMGVAPSETLVIEDSPPGLAAAQAAGMSVLAYGGGAHLRDMPSVAPAGIRSFDNWSEFPHLLKMIDMTEARW